MQRGDRRLNLTHVPCARPSFEEIACRVSSPPVPNIDPIGVWDDQQRCVSRDFWPEEEIHPSAALTVESHLDPIPQASIRTLQTDAPASIVASDYADKRRAPSRISR
jgi:hypothetical protein